MSWSRQGARFVVVGLASNIGLYLIYLLLTAFGLGHKTAMTLLYLLGVAQTFFLNRNWTFQHRGPSGRSFWRYATAYCVGYLLNLAALSVFVDWLGLPHALVQGVAIPVFAIGLFLVQRYWIFANPDASAPEVTAASATTR
jgi:putative flippase GtrA